MAGTPDVLLHRLHSVLNAAVRLVFSARRCDHMTLLLCQLRWLKVPERVRLRLCVLTYCCLNGTAPHYLAEIWPGNTSTPPISGDVNPVGTVHASFDFRWSVIPSGCRSGLECSTTAFRNAPSLSVFRRELETVLFRLSFPDAIWQCSVLYLLARHSVLICHHLLVATNWFRWHCTVVLQQQCDNAT